MKPLSALVAALALLAFTPAADTLRAAEEAGRKPAAPMGETGRRIVATVDGVPVYADELQQTSEAQEKVLRYQYREDSERLEKELASLRQSTLEGLIDRCLLLSEFKRIGGELNPGVVDKDMDSVLQDNYKGDLKAFAEELAQNGLTLEKFRQLRENMIIMNAMRARFAGKVTVTDEEARRYYDRNPQRWSEPEQVKIRTLTLPGSQENAAKVAADLRQKIAAGSLDFAEAARAHSQDSHAESGGAWDWLTVTDLSDHVRKATTQTPKGQISEVLQQGGSLIILRVDDRRAPAPPAFEAVKALAAEALRDEISQARYTTALSNLRAKADIRKMDAH